MHDQNDTQAGANTYTSQNTQNMGNQNQSKDKGDPRQRSKEQPGNNQMKKGGQSAYSQPTNTGTQNQNTQGTSPNAASGSEDLEAFGDYDNTK